MLCFQNVISPVIEVVDLNQEKNQPMYLIEITFVVNIEHVMRDMRGYLFETFLTVI